MNETEQVIFNRIAGFGIERVQVATNITQGEFKGTGVTVNRPDEEGIDFFFPDYAGMSDAEMAEVVANNLRLEVWNSVKP